MLLLSLLGCFPIDDVAVTRSETGFFVDDIVDDSGDTGGPKAKGGVHLTYTWDAPMLPSVQSCATAGVSVLTLDPGDGRQPIGFPCADDEIRVDDVYVGHHVLTVVGETQTGVLYRATAEIDVAEGAVADVPVVLECDENGVDDGCGGA